MTTIYLIRHAEAEGNLYRRVHGVYDSLVTLRGHKQIAALKKRFEKIKIDAVYSSDLLRTIRTAGAIYLNHHLPLIVMPRLREVNMGVWEDRPWGEVERFEPEQLDKFNNDPAEWRVEGAEDYFTLQDRMTRALRDIAARHDGETVAVFSHGQATRTFLAGVLGVPPKEIGKVKHSDNTAVSLLRADGGDIAVEWYGDNAHLTEEISTFAHQKWWRENATFDSTNLRFEPFDLKNDAGRYTSYRLDAYRSVYAEELDPRPWLEQAEASARAHPRAVSLALIYDTPVGMVELDTRQGEADKAGVVDFFYMVPEQRRTGIAVQLLGQAVSVYRALGREKLRMTVSEKNVQAAAFCQRYGFEAAREFENRFGKHFIMEMNIAVV
jgi:probable phosphoglycerate mutase